MGCPGSDIWKFNCRLPPGFQVSQPKLTLCPSGSAYQFSAVTPLNRSSIGSTYGGNHLLIGYQTQPRESKQQTQGPLFVQVSPLLLWRQAHLPSRKIEGDLPTSTPGRAEARMLPPSPSPPSLPEFSGGCPARKGEEEKPQPPEEVPSIRSLSSVQTLSRVRLFATPWTAAGQPPYPSPTPGACSKLMSIESVMSSNLPAMCKSRMKRN